MKKFLLGSLAALLTFVPIHPEVRAQGLPGDSLDVQNTQAVAFVKTDRSILYIKRPGQPVDAYDIAALDQAAGDDPNTMDSIRNIGIIGMTPQGDRIVLGAAVYYLNSNNSTHDIFRGILSIPWPITASNLNSKPIQFLEYASKAGFRPSGVLSADGSEWWAVTSSGNPGSSPPLTFYHGHTGGSGTIDSATVTAQIAGMGAALQDGYYVSNIAIDRPSKTMIATSFDGINSDQLQSGRALFYRWNLSNQQLSASNFTGNMKTLNTTLFDNIDSSFGLTVFPANDGFYAYVGMTPTSDNSIELYKVAFNDANIVVSPSNVTYTIPRTAIPSNENFFAGPNCGAYGEDLAGPEGGQNGNSGDVNFSVTGDTAVFITRESPFDCPNRDASSAIWMYDLTAQPQSATLVYNDPSAQELQPVFVPAKDTIAHTPGIMSNVSSPVNFGTVDTAKTGGSAITVTDTSLFDGTIIDSAKVTGPNASDFTITSPTFPYTMNRNSSVQLLVAFAPVKTAGTRTATLTLYSLMSSNPTITIGLTGKAAVQPAGGGGVAEDPSLAANMAIDPNPFTSQTSVRLTAHEAGALGIIVHDALGRTVYTSDIRQAGAGATETFAFDAKSLGLSSGVYVVTGLFGDRSASREVVLTR